MKWFEQYSSNTMAGSGNQSAFEADPGVVHVGRVYYKALAGGTYGYSFLYTNILDSTFANGDKTVCNMICDEWEIVGATVGVCAECSAEWAAEPQNVQTLTFGGQESKIVMPGEFFTSDETEITAEKGGYLCIEIKFRGTLIPCHPESIIPAFVREDGAWKPSQQLPFVSMVGCTRPVAAKVGFMGDSITQGIGTPYNAYSHWNALCAEQIGTKWSWWNLGLGYARAYDASSNGAWLFKGKQCDIVVVCYGTNDVGHNRTADQIIGDLKTIVEKLHLAGAKVLLQTLPPFDWKDEKLAIWLEVNRRIREELRPQADAFFDIAPVLCEDEQTGVAKYGGHPDEKGCAKWAEGLVPVIKALLEK